MRRQVRCIGLAMLLPCAVAVQAWGWGNGGHMAVAYVAYENLTPQVRERVDALIKLNPKYQTWLASLPAGTSPGARNEMLFMIAATWPDQIKSDNAYHADGSAGGDRPPADATAGQNLGYADMAMHKYWHFIDEPISQDGTPTQDPSTPNAETQITVFRATLASDSPDALKSYDLAWLLHLVGDVHQPLHCASRFDQAQPQGDAGGNEVKVCTVRSRGGSQAGGGSASSRSQSNCKGNLHAFWDDLFGTSPKPAPAIKVGKSLPAAPAGAAPGGGSDLSVDDWVKESSGEAAKDVYVAPIGPGAGPYTITAAYRRAALALARQRIALAGARLAGILNAELK